MTPRKAITRADETKPNAFSEEVKFEWLRALEGRIAADVFLLAKSELDTVTDLKYPADLDSELIVEPPHDELYIRYLQARIDEQNGEYNRYADSRQLYNEAYGNFVRWFARTYEPAQGYGRRYTIV